MDESEKSQRLIVTLPRDMYEDIKRLAEYNRRPMAEEIRIAIEDRLKKVKRPKDDREGQRVAVAVA